MTDRQAYTQNKRTIRWLNRFKISSGSGAEERYDYAIEALKRANEVLDYKIRTSKKSALSADEIANAISYLHGRIYVDTGKSAKVIVVGSGEVIDVQSCENKIYIVCRGVEK